MFQALIPNLQPLADPDVLAGTQLHRSLGLLQAAQAQHRARRIGQRRGILAPRVSRRDRHAADGRGGQAVFERHRAPIAARGWSTSCSSGREFADYWALKWADLLRVDRTALGHKGAYAYYHWIRDRVADNTPLDKFATQIITAEGPLSEVPQAQLFKVAAKPGDMASTVSQVFLGVRIACAQCHHHPFDRWSQSDYYGMLDLFRSARPQGIARWAKSCWPAARRKRGTHGRAN